MPMRDTPRSSPATAAALAGLVLCLATAAPSPADDATNRYEAIVRRAPFGRVPRQPTPEELAAALAAQTPTTDENVEKLADTIRLNALTSYRGVPAAGFFDSRSKQSFLLLQGQSLGGYTLESVDFRRATARLARDGIAEDIALTFASGQPTNLLTHPTHALPPEAPAANAAASKTDSPSPAANEPPQAVADSALSPEAIAAATVVDPSGETRISFRELHRLRVQQSREKAEKERLQREAQSAAAKAAADALEKKRAEEAELILQLEEKARKEHRAKVIEAIKQGQDVTIDFELTAAEAKALAAAGFAIPEEALKAEPAAEDPPAPTEEP